MSSTDQALPNLAAFSGALPAHLFMPPDGVAFDPAAYISLPAIGVTSTVVSITVSDGYLAVIRSMGNAFVGSGFIDGSGSLIWQLLDNGMVIRNYDNIVSSLGAVNNPALIGGGGGIIIPEGHAIILQCQNVSLSVGGASVGGRLGGWFIPKARIPDEAAIF